MSLITITSDLGKDSYALAALKGAIYQNVHPGGNVVDISNEIRSFDIVEAAFVFANSYPYFPEKTIHILSVNPFYSPQYEVLLFAYQQQYFIAPNHGILPLIFKQPLEGTLVKLPPCKDTKEYYQLLGSTIKALEAGEALESIGTADPELYLKISLQPVVNKNIIRGTIIHIDRFGNLISNIDRSTFEKIRGERKFAIYFRHKDPISSISQHYHDVAVGDELCLFNMSDHLEIAINMADASQTLGLNLDDTIQIDFFD
jgi:S-adenosylmethionine hydrolase